MLPNHAKYSTGIGSCVSQSLKIQNKTIWQSFATFFVSKYLYFVSKGLLFKYIQFIYCPSANNPGCIRFAPRFRNTRFIIITLLFT